MAGDEYPKREKFFANKVVRAMHKTCAAQEMGITATMLVTFVAHVEDGKRYSKAPTFHNGQLIPILAVKKWDTFDKARRDAVKAGWLHYEAPPRGSRKPGVYWALIPDHYEGIDDAPLGEDSYPENGDGRGDTQAETYPQNGDTRGDGRGDTRGDTHGELPYLSLRPNPKETTDVVSSSEPADDSEPSTPPVLVFPTSGKGAKTWDLTKTKLAEYVECFQGLDVLAECRRALQWCRDNPKKRKTPTGMLRFLTTWLNREQNRNHQPKGTDNGRGQPVSGRFHGSDPPDDDTFWTAPKVADDGAAKQSPPGGAS